MIKLHMDNITFDDKLKVIAFYKNKKVRQKTFYRKIKPNKDHFFYLPMKKGEKVDNLEVYTMGEKFIYPVESEFEEEGFQRIVFRLNIESRKMPFFF